ncbi:MAG: 3-phosphoshikimate 1-carboxyvinyltransferase [Ignavibacteriae bacterium HGW-Ignavibacteriae-3]|nr:MAG: 3-phosphoshikimate 1-carboxyvinyltransferase [Ignavibacteriae bacterium HGW-Ignavibacteriae-3]
MIQQFKKIENLRGELILRGDKSISHRSVMFASMADGVSIIRNCSDSEDVSSTINCFEKLGCSFEKENGLIKVTGRGFKGFSVPDSELYAGNSGTTARLISGILSAQDFGSIITGDESLSSRPMMRIIDPLRNMGADIIAGEKGFMPIRIYPSKMIKPVNYILQVSSAQVKSALILCAIHLEEESIIVEPGPTRNHTEKLLGLKTVKSDEGTKIFCSKKNYPEPFEITIPSDISSASFFIVLALLTKNSALTVKSVSLNETRTGVLDILKKMGGKIEIEYLKEEKGEPVGNIKAYSSELKNIDIPESIIPNIIDEIPILSVAGLFAEGNFKITGAKELRVKESDRIKSLCHNFKLAGVDVTEFGDGLELKGNIGNEAVTLESFGDHRIAMAFGVMSMLMKNGGSVNNFESVGISNPKFVSQINQLIG